MRLSPKSIFFGIVALGLPFAVTIGWTLGTPTRAPASTAGLGGAEAAGRIGAAPGKPAKPRAVTPVDYGASSAPPPPSSSTVPSAPVPSSPAEVPVSATPEPPTPTAGSPLPTLMLPPVPTPTEITTDPSASPSGPASSSAQPESSSIDPATLAGRS